MDRETKELLETMTDLVKEILTLRTECKMLRERVLFLEDEKKFLLDRLLKTIEPNEKTT